MKKPKLEYYLGILEQIRSSKSHAEAVALASIALESPGATPPQPKKVRWWNSFRKKQ